MVAICLLLKADIVISLDSVPVSDTEHQPFDAVPDEEGNVEQFPLLSHMNELMIYGSGAQRFFGQNELAPRQRQEILPKRNSLNFQYLGHDISDGALLSLGLVLVHVFTWRHAIEFLEDCGEGCGIVESTGIHHFGDIHVLRRQ